MTTTKKINDNNAEACVNDDKESLCCIDEI